MASKRRAEAMWREDRQCWDIKVQKKGVRKHFTSAIKGRKGKHDAEQKADDWLERGTESMGAAEAWDTYIADIKENSSVSTYTQAERLGRIYIRPIFARRRLEDITPAIWQTAINNAAKAGLSRRTCVNVRAQITAFLKYCRLHRWSYDRVEDGDLTIPRSATPPKPKKALTDDELTTVFTVDTITVNHSHGAAYGTVQKKCFYIYAFRFLILTGLRRGELCGLKKSDINGDTLTISRSINTYGEVTHGKTDNARRSFVLTPSMLQVLEDQRKYHESIGLSPSQWLFPDQWGERLDPNKLYDHWRTYREKLGISASLHDLRHTFISLTKSDLPMELLKAQVGHSTAMDTALIYGHEVDGDRVRAANIIEQTISKHIKKAPAETDASQKVGAEMGADK